MLRAYSVLNTNYSVLPKMPETLLPSCCYTAQGFGKSEAPNAAFSDICIVRIAYDAFFAPSIADDAVADCCSSWMYRDP